MAEPLATRLRLVLVTPGRRAAEATVQLVQAALDGGVTAVLLREPQLDADARSQLYAELLLRCRDAGALSLVSRDPELARQLGADGVQLGHGSPPLSEVRAAWPEGILTRSAHWPLLAEDLAADACTLSPVAPTPASRPRPLLTPEQIEQACARLAPKPVIALGGVELSKLDALPSSFSGVAVLRALAEAADPRGRAAQLRSLLDARHEFGGGALR